MISSFGPSSSSPSEPPASPPVRARPRRCPAPCLRVAASLVAASLVVSVLGACAERPGCPPRPARPASSLKLATTTSTDNTGLLGVLLPPFTQRYGVDVKVIAVGTGKAIKLGENGDVDAILVHARRAEDAFVAAGFGVNRRDVMHNDFVIVGPAGDPAGVKGMARAAAALAKIQAAGSFFVSRGDESGTHKREQQLWEAAGVQPGGGAYLSAGQGMGAVLTMASEKGAYTLTDRGTFLAWQSKLQLSVLVQGDPGLYNPYGVIAVNPARHPHVRYVEAMTLVGWLTSVEGQGIIGRFRVRGTVLFHPDAVPEAP